MLKIAMREAGKVRILDLKGKINHGEGAQVLEDAVKRLVSEGFTNIVLNMKEVEWVDSSGMGEMVASRLRVHRAHGGIKLVMPSKPVLDLLVIVGLHKVFEIYDDEIKAVGSF